LNLSVPSVCVLSGCLTNALWNERKAQIKVLIVENVPAEAETIDIDDSRLEDLSIVREMVNRAIQEGNIARRLGWDRAKRLDQKLREELPMHDYRVYIRKGDTVCSVSIWYQS
jgi:hypothetical protein